MQDAKIPEQDLIILLKAAEKAMGNQELNQKEREEISGILNVASNSESLEFKRGQQ